MSLHWACALLLLCSALYEPLRVGFHKLGQEVGGVGGVGGLTNLGDPDSCSSTAGKIGAYCFREGVLLGLSPFALIFLICWVLPFCVVAYLQKPTHPVSVCEPLAGRDHKALGRSFVFIWVGLSILWFSVPLAMYSTDPFFQRDAYHMILAVAIAAAFPLSWHLSLVAVPVPPFIAEQMHMSHTELLSYHKMIAAATGGWAGLHAAGEVTWFISQRSWEPLNIIANGENLIYLCGSVAAVLLVVHFLIAQVRRKLDCFKQLHRFLAAVLLFVAAAHWWPFAFFLIPTIGVHATSIALKQSRVERPATGKALACATVAATVAVSLVWKLRQSYMVSSNAGLHLPFLFPPMALLAGFGAALCVSTATMNWLR